MKLIFYEEDNNMRVDPFDKEVCDECENCKHYWRNNDTDEECTGQDSGPCFEYSEMKKE